MNTEDIKTLLAQQMLKFVDPDASASFDKARNVDRGDKSRQDLVDDALLYAKGEILAVHLEPLMNADPSNVYEAFQFFGPHAIQAFVLNLAGAEEFNYHKPFCMACVKIGNPDLTWQQVDDIVMGEDFNPTNPQKYLTRSYDKQMREAVMAFQSGQKTPEDIPYVPDRSYLGSLTRVENAGFDFNNPIKHAQILLDYVFDYCEKKLNRTQDEDLRLCGLMVLAIVLLPGYKDYENWENKGLSEVLRKNTASFVLLDWPEPIPELEILRKRLEQFPRNGMFENPYMFAASMYERDLKEKLKQALAGTGGSKFIPGEPEIP